MNMWNNNNYSQYSRVPFNAQNNMNMNYMNSNPYYQPTVQPNFSQSQNNNNNSQNNIIWVTGKENARSMQLQPNSAVIMLDNESNKFYIKTTDDIGLGRLRVFTYQEEKDTTNSTADTTVQRNQEQQQVPSVDLSNYVTKDELKQMLTTLKGEKKYESSLSTVKSANDF